MKNALMTQEDYRRKEERRRRALLRKNKLSSQQVNEEEIGRKRRSIPIRETEKENEKDEEQEDDNDNEEEKRLWKKRKLIDEMEDDEIISLEDFDFEEFEEDIDPSEIIDDKQRVEYNKQLKTTVESHMVGKFYVPLDLLTPPREEMRVRKLNDTFILILEQQIRRKSVGVHFRTALQINVYPKSSSSSSSSNDMNEDDLKKLKQYEDEIKEIIEISSATKQLIDHSQITRANHLFTNLLFDNDFKRLFALETIGGNHTREAFQRILKNPKDNDGGEIDLSLYGKTISTGVGAGAGGAGDKNNNYLYNCLESVVYYNLTKSDAHQIGLTDNAVQVFTQKMTESDKVVFIYERWNDPDCLVEAKKSGIHERQLKPEVKMNIVENIFGFKAIGEDSKQKPLKKKGESTKSYEKRIEEWKDKKMTTEARNQNPAIKFLNMNPSLFAAFLKIVELPPDARYTLGALRSYQTIYDPEGNEIAYKNYIKIIEEIYQDGVGKDKNGRRTFKGAIRKAKENFINDLKRIQLNAKFATTILNILQTHSEFKSSNNINKPYPWNHWKNAKDLIDYCREKNISIEKCFHHNIDILNKIKKPKKFDVIISLAPNEVEQVIERLNILFKDVIHECNQPDKEQIEEEEEEGEMDIVVEQNQDEQLVDGPNNQITNENQQIINSDIQKKSNEKQQQQQIEMKKYSMKIFNSKDMMSNHIFYVDDVFQKPPNGIFSIPNNLLMHIKLIIIDPPFGILRESWDIRWLHDDFEELIMRLKAALPTIPILIFYSGNMLPDLLKIVSTIKYKFEFLYWHMLGKAKNTTAALNYDISPILMIYHDRYNLPNLWSNYFSCTVDKFTQYKKQPVNVTQKPIRLLKYLIASFLNLNDTTKGRSQSYVLDLCSGSGSTAIAAASLGVSSISFDKRRIQIISTIGRFKKIRWQQVDKISYKQTSTSDSTSNDLSTSADSESFKNLLKSVNPSLPLPTELTEKPNEQNPPPVPVEFTLSPEIHAFESPSNLITIEVSEEIADENITTTDPELIPEPKENLHDGPIEIEITNDIIVLPEANENKEKESPADSQ
jgi:hypothetical protein